MAASTNPTGITLTEETADLLRNILAQVQLSSGSPNFETDAAALSKARKELGMT